jgi:eukaryotic-like serine/threonine-protein kinase
MEWALVNLDELWDQLHLDSLVQPTHETLRPSWDDNLQQTFELTGTQPVSTLEKFVADDVFAVERRLGQGGMGEVWQAKQQSLGREVAVKRPLHNASESAVMALVREAQVTGSLEHPGIVPVHTMAFDARGIPAMVMKRVEGVSWGELLRLPGHPTWTFLTASQDTLEANLGILMQVCSAVAFAHRQGVVHRDLKPANILVGDYGEVYVADWGVARRLSATSKRSLSLVGTPAYFAPEMVSGDDARMGIATDIYLLGATLYHVLTGHVPNAGADLREVLTRASSPSLRAFSSDIPDELVAICHKAMHREPSQRYSAALELRTAIALFIQHRSTLRLIEKTTERLRALQEILRTKSASKAVSGGRDQQTNALISECRFGFMQALQSWPDNQSAQSSLHETLVLAATHEISLGHESAAQALMNELKQVPSGLQQALEDLLEANEASSIRKANYLRLQRELDPRTALWARIRFFAVIAGGLVLGTLLPVFAWWNNFLAAVGVSHLTMRLVLGILAWALSVAVHRKSLLKTKVNRSVVQLVGLTILAIAASRSASYTFHLSVPQILTFDLLPSFCIGAASAVTMHKGFGLMSVFSLTGLLGILWMPEHAVAIYSVASVSGLMAVAVTWMSWHSELE